MRVRLIKKLAGVLNDVDLAHRQVGQVFDCAEQDARMLVLERWAVVIAERLEDPPSPDDGPLANERPHPSVLQIIDLHREGKKDKLA